MPTDNYATPKEKSQAEQDKRTTMPTLAEYLESIELSRIANEKLPDWKLNPGWRS